MKDNWQVISRKSIDDKAWNECIKTSSTPLIYALTYYLDAIHPGWKGLVLMEGKGYHAVIPLTVRKVLNIPLLFHPIFAQQLGVFGKNDIDTYQLLIDKFPFINYQGNTGEHILDKEHPGITWRTNVVKPLTSEAEVMKGYNQNRKRDIKKAVKAGLTISDIKDCRVIIDLFKSTKGKEVKDFKSVQYKRLYHMVLALQQRGQVHLSGVYDAKGMLVSGGIFTLYKKRITFLFGTSSAAGKKSGAMTYLLHEMIKAYADTYHLFDFEGSDIEGLKKYYKSFGGKVEPYPLYYSNNLPWLLKMIIR